ncbi:MAG: pilus assembly protein PilM [Candidatus Nomurabacteria bacterium]|jgi:cell division protein FtsA|nr:pilus assembly protein PilM [Candidatus Nomurabacteria bacterium]
MSLLKKKNQPAKEVILALDIGTEFVKAVAARVNDRMEIIGATKLRQPLSNMHAGAIADISGVTGVVEQALIEVEKQAQTTLKKVVVGIAGELIKGETSTIIYRRQNPEERITVEEMENIVEKVEARVSEKMQKQIAIETSSPDAKIRLVNSALVGIQIDGYKINNPIGFQGKEVAVQIYTAFAPLVHIGAIEKVCDELNLELAAVATEPFAVFRAVTGNDLSSQLTAILVDIGGGTTDVAVVDDGGVEGTKSFAIGGRSFTRQIASEMDVDYEEAEKLKLAEDTESVENKERIEMAIAKNLKVWKVGVELTLEEFGGLDHLPSKILLCGGGSSLPQIKETLDEPDFHEALPFSKKPAVQLIKYGDLHGLRNETETVLDHSFVTAIGMLWVGSDTVLEPEKTDIISKLNKVLKH